MADVDQLGPGATYAFDGASYSLIGPFRSGTIYVLWALDADATLIQGGSDIAALMDVDDSDAVLYNAATGIIDSFRVGNPNGAHPAFADTYLAIKKTTVGAGSIKVRSRRAGVALPVPA